MQTIQTEEFARLPDALRLGKGTRGNFLEGPSFDRDGNFYCVDVRGNRIYRIDPTGKTWDVVIEYDGQPNGLKIAKDGSVFVADRKNGLIKVDVKRGTFEAIVSGPRVDTRFKGINDLVISQTGDFYFTDQGRTGLQDPSGCVYKFSATGDLRALLTNAPSPNGLVLNKRETGLYVAITRANAVWRVDLTDPSLRTGLFVQIPSAGPDGLAVDAEGNIAVTHPGIGTVWLYSKTGKLLAEVVSCTGEKTVNVAYGGVDNRMLYITESRTSTIIRAMMPYPGMPLVSHS